MVPSALTAEPPKPEILAERKLPVMVTAWIEGRAPTPTRIVAADIKAAQQASLKPSLPNIWWPNRAQRRHPPVVKLA